MSRVRRAREANESGVVLIIVALAMVVLLGMVAIAIDASYGFVQNRRAQNASDFAAFAAAQELNNSTYCNGSTQPSMQELVSIIHGVVNDNDAAVGNSWTAQFLDNEDPPKPIGPAFTPSDYTTEFPDGHPDNNTCGVIVSTTPSWSTFFAGILGLHHMGGYATASVAPTSPTANGIGIVALNQAGPHEVLGGGTGQFNVSGTIFLNTNTSAQPWSGSSASVTGSTNVETSPAVVITAGINDTVVVSYDGTSYTLTIAPGTYTGTPLVTAIQNAMRAVGLCPPNDSCHLVAAYNYSGQLVLSTRDVTYTATSLQVTGGDALDTLGLSVMPAPVVGNVFNDAIDAKASSNLYVYGTIDTNDGTVGSEKMWPLDTCFEPEGAIATGNAQTLGSGNPPGVQMSCTAAGNSSVTVDYNAIDNSFPQETDPLQAQGAPPNPFSAGAANNCPGMSTVTDPTPLVNGTTTTMYPGVYDYPVDLTGNTVFDDCGGYNDSPESGGQPEGASPGIYIFQDGLQIDPAAGDTVSGSDIVLGTQNPDPIPGNVPGSLNGLTFTPSGPGNGAPCLPAGTLTDLQSGEGSHAAETDPNAPCAGTGDFGVNAFHDSPISPDASNSGTGTNFSALVGGQGTVSLTGPTTGAYGGDGADGIVLYQDPNTEGNYGFDAEAGDSAGVTINGVVYNASLTNYGVGGLMDYWDGEGGGVVFYQGGTLQTGYGTGWSNGPTQSSGSVTINGTAVVDDFNTDGTTDITIDGGTYTPPGGNHLQLIG